MNNDKSICYIFIPPFQFHKNAQKWKLKHTIFQINYKMAQPRCMWGSIFLSWSFPILICNYWSFNLPIKWLYHLVFVGSVLFLSILRILFNCNGNLAYVPRPRNPVFVLLLSKLKERLLKETTLVLCLGAQRSGQREKKGKSRFLQNALKLSRE